MINRLQKATEHWLLDTYKRSKQQSADTGLQNCIATTRHMLSKTEYCFLITHSATEWSSARLVQPIPDINTFTIWIGTCPRLRKVREIKNNNKVTLAFESTKENANLILYGEAFIEENLAIRKRYWKDEWRLFFPGGPISDDYIVLRVEPVKIELMSFSRNVVQEPFGLSPAVLIKRNGVWNMQVQMSPV